MYICVYVVVVVVVVCCCVLLCSEENERGQAQKGQWLKQTQAQIHIEPNNTNTPQRAAYTHRYNTYTYAREYTRLQHHTYHQHITNSSSTPQTVVDDGQQALEHAFAELLLFDHELVAEEQKSKDRIDVNDDPFG